MCPRPRLKKKGKNSPSTMGHTKQNQSGGLTLTVAMTPLLMAVVARLTRSSTHVDGRAVPFCAGTQKAEQMYYYIRHWHALSTCRSFNANGTEA